MLGLACFFGMKMSCEFQHQGVTLGIFLAFHWPKPGSFAAWFTPRKTLKRDYFNRKFIFQPSIFRGHVSFRGCITWYPKHLRIFEMLFFLFVSVGWFPKLPWKTRWWQLKDFLFFTPIPGVSWSNLTCAYFSDWLVVQPPTRCGNSHQSPWFKF